MIRSIDTRAAAKAPGVVAVMTSEDLGPGGRAHSRVQRAPRAADAVGIPPLAAGRVRFVGEPVVAVVATDRYRAQDAVDLVNVDYEPLPAVADVEAAARPGRAAGARGPGEQRGRGVAAARGRSGRGDPRRRRGRAGTLRQARGGAHPLETRGLVARFADGQLTVWAAIQMVHRHRSVIAQHVGLPEEQVRVIAPADVGGGFGTKGQWYPEDILVPPSRCASAAR